MSLAVVLNLALICHLIGDYLLQSDWMAQSKTRETIPALAHVLTYSLPFWLLLHLSGEYEVQNTAVVLSIIASTHFVIDRWRLARYVVWLKNFLSPPTKELRRKQKAAGSAGNTFIANESGLRTVDGWFQDPEDSLLVVKYVRKWWDPWSECSGTGYSSERPAWLTTWLLIIADNTLHLAINAAALIYFYVPKNIAIWS